mgnify:CR=1 FL=1
MRRFFKMEYNFNKNIVNNIGILEVITGSMFSGKSEELIRRLRRAEYAGQKTVVFSPSIDDRYGKEGIYSHGKDSFKGYPVNSVDQMEEIMKKNNDAQVIGIDEVQFLGEETVKFCKKYVEYGKRIIVAGLDMSFRAEPYHPLPELMSIADRVDKFNAICTICGKPAYASQRLIDGEPAYYDDPLIMVGASENYEARCRRHHIVRHRKNEKGTVYFFVGTEINTGKKEVEQVYREKLPNKKKSETIVIKSDVGEKKETSGEEEDKNTVSQLRERIEKAVSENDYVFIRITGGLLLPLEGNYSILDFICEYRKNSKIVVVTKNKKGLLNQLLIFVDLLKKSDLNIEKIVYKNFSEEKEKQEVMEKIKKMTEIKYEII